MRNGEFILNGVHSSEFGAVIQSRPQINVPNRRRIRFSIPGSDGEYVIDDEAYDNSEMELNIAIKGPDYDTAKKYKDILSGILSSVGYVSFTPYFDPDVEYYVFLGSELEYSQNGYYDDLYVIRAVFSVRPYKHLIAHTPYKASKDVMVNNPFEYSSNPKINIKGSGNGILNVNGIEYIFKNVDDSIVVDSETKNAYKESGSSILNRNDRMYTIDFPTLKPGMNTISISGGFTSFTVEPRWRNLI